MERERVKERNEAKSKLREIKRHTRMETMPEILNEKSTNTGVQALRDAIRLAWVDQSLALLKKHLSSAEQLNNE